jgi:Lar family restriction alleviation protein
MTNGEKFKTPVERRRAYNQYFEQCEKENSGIMDEFVWIDIEYKEELKPCPFCGGEAMKRKSNRVYYVFCTNCSVKTVDSITPDGAIAAWNRRV